MTEIRLVGFAGPIGAGKNAAADAWADIIVEHSDPIYSALAAALGVSVQWLRENKESQVDQIPGRPTVRFLLATMGTDWGRETVSPDIWVALAAPRIQVAKDAGLRVGVPGIRFVNEAESIRRLGGIVIWVHRPGTASVSGHSSERSLKPEDCDWVVANSGSRDSLREKVAAVVARHSR